MFGLNRNKDKKRTFSKFMSSSEATKAEEAKKKKLKKQEEASQGTLNLKEMFARKNNVS